MGSSNTKTEQGGRGFGRKEGGREGGREGGGSRDEPGKGVEGPERKGKGRRQARWAVGGDRWRVGIGCRQAVCGDKWRG